MRFCYDSKGVQWPLPFFSFIWCPDWFTQSIYFYAGWNTYPHTVEIILYDPTPPNPLFQICLNYSLYLVLFNLRVKVFCLFLKLKSHQLAAEHFPMGLWSGPDLPADIRTADFFSPFSPPPVSRFSHVNQVTLLDPVGALLKNSALIVISVIRFCQFLTLYLSLPLSFSLWEQMVPPTLSLVLLEVSASY